MTPEQREEIRELAKTRKEPHHIICVPASQLLSLIEERDKLEARIAELESREPGEARWISVEERLPSEGKPS